MTNCISIFQKAFRGISAAMRLVLGSLPSGYLSGPLVREKDAILIPVKNATASRKYRKH